MLKQIEGSKAVAEAIALCRPEVICAYPITPQTHIVEGLGELVKKGELKHCEYINVESEFAAMSVAIGSSAAGVRSYTATSSQGLLFMTEAVYNASGMGLPIVMTLGNRSVGAPLNIWNDHTDAMIMRDAGWIQLFAETNQEAVDLHIQAFRIAEQLSIPVMVCVDGFILTHAYERIEVPTQEQVDAYLPRFVPQQELDTNAPLAMGTTVGPDAFTEVKYFEHQKMLRAPEVIARAAEEFKAIFGREAGGLIRAYRADDAETVVVAMGSVLGSIKDVIDARRKKGDKIGALSVCSFRPFPDKEIGEALKNAKNIIAVEKCLNIGQDGILANHIRLAKTNDAKVTMLLAGLGGRPILEKSLSAFLDKVESEDLGGVQILDLKEDIIEQELERAAQEQQTGERLQNVA
jgi:pyruvate ferredoxin oxidoreductase alpha subunit